MRDAVFANQPACILPARGHFRAAKAINLLGEGSPMRAHRAIGSKHFVKAAIARAVKLRQARRRCESWSRVHRSSLSAQSNRIQLICQVKRVGCPCHRRRGLPRRVKAHIQRQGKFTRPGFIVNSQWARRMPERKESRDSSPFGLVGINRKAIVAPAARMRNMILAATDGSARPKIHDIENQRRIDGDRRVQAARSAARHDSERRRRIAR